MVGAILTAGALITGLWWLSTMLEYPALALAWAGLLVVLVAFHLRNILRAWNGELEPEPLPPGPFESQ